MPKPTKGPRLGGSPAHQRLILANLATQLFEHGRITTTESRARALRPHAENLITKAKKGDLHNRREVLKTIRDKSVVHVLFTEIGPQMDERPRRGTPITTDSKRRMHVAPAGHTRITKSGNRKGDNAPMAVIELVQEPYKPADKKPAQKAATKAAAPKADENPAEERTGEPVTEDADTNVGSEETVLEAAEES